MRSARSVLVAAAAALAACGNYSTDDIAFLEALPTRESLAVAVPAASAQALCGGLGDAKTATEARQSGAHLNAFLDWILGVVDLLRATPPTQRHRDERIWGPFADRNHPGAEIRFTIRRRWDAAGVPTYAFAFEARRQAVDATWLAVIDGAFIGASARTGHGTVAIHFPRIRTLALYDPLDPPPILDVPIGYDRSGDPRTLEVHIAANDGGQGLVGFDYAFAGWTSGHRRLDFALTNAFGDRFEESAHFDPAGAGQGDVAFWPAAFPGLRYNFRLCWDAAGCVSALEDLGGRSGYLGCVAGTPCVVNWPSGCPAGLK